MTEDNNLHPAKTGINPKLANIILIGQSHVAANLRRMVTLAAHSNAPLLFTGNDREAMYDLASAVHARSVKAWGDILYISCADDSEYLQDTDFYTAVDMCSILLTDLDKIPNDMSGNLERLLLIDGVRIMAYCESISHLQRCENMPPRLFRALSTLQIPVATLMQRLGDIPLLAEALIFRLRKNQRFTLHRSARTWMQQHDWPSGFAELQVMIQSLSGRHAGQQVHDTDIEAYLQKGKVNRIAPVSARPKYDITAHLEREEAKLISMALTQAEGVVQRASSLTGIKRTTLLARMKKYGIKRPE